MESGKGKEVASINYEGSDLEQTEENLEKLYKKSWFKLKNGKAADSQKYTFYKVTDSNLNKFFGNAMAINKKKTIIYKGLTQKLKVIGATKKVKWSSSNKKVATVNSKGVVTAKKKGTAIVTAKVGKKKFKCKVTVKVPNYQLNKTKTSVKKGKNVQLKIKYAPKYTKWSSSNKKVATVNSKGLVTAKKAGKTTITAKIGKKKLRCKVTVDALTYVYAFATGDADVFNLKNGTLTINLSTEEKYYVKNGKYLFTQWEEIGKWKQLNMKVSSSCKYCYAECDDSFYLPDKSNTNFKQIMQSYKDDTSNEEESGGCGICIEVKNNKVIGITMVCP